MRRLWLLSSLAFAMGCNCGAPDFALKVVVKVDPAQPATCAVLEVMDATGAVRATQDLERAPGKNELIVGLKRGDLPPTVSLKARAFISGTGCALPRNFNGDSAVVSATFPVKGVETVTVELHPPDATLDADRDGYVQVALGGLDCDDGNSAIRPGAAQLCTSQADEDCDGLAGCSDPDCTQTAACQRTPDRLVFVTPPQTVDAGACSPVLTLEAQDAAGSTAAQQGLAAQLSANPATGVTFYSDANCATVATSATIPQGQTRASFYFKATQGGTTFTASASVIGLTPATQLETVTFPPATQLAFSNPARTVGATLCSAALTVELRDANNVATQVGGAVTVAVTSGSAGPSFFSDASCTTALAAGALTVAAGSSSGTFYAQSAVAGTPLLTAASTGLASATQTLTVTPGVPSRIRFTTSPQGIATNTCSGVVRVETQDAAGNTSPVAAATTVTLTASPATGFTFYSDVNCTTPIATVDVAAGASSASFRFRGTAVANVDMTASTNALGSDVQAASIGAGPPAALAFTTAAQTNVVAGTCSGVVTVQSQDASGNPSNITGSPLAVTLTAPAPLQFFSDSSCTAGISGTALAVGGTTASFYFKSTLAGAVQVTAGSSLTSPNQTETIVAGAAVSIAFLGAAQTVTAGVCSATLTVEARDVNGNPALVGAATVVTLSSAATGVTFFSSTNCSAASTTTVTIAGGQSQVTFSAKATVAATYTLTAQTAALGSDTQQFTVNAGAATALVFNPLALSVDAGACSGAVALERRDTNANLTPLGGQITVALGTTATGAFSFYAGAGCAGAPITTLDIPAAASSAQFSMKATVAQVAPVTGTLAGLTTANHTLTVNAAAADKLVFNPLLETVASGACSATVTLERRDPSNNLTTVGGQITVALASNASGAFSFYAGPGCAGAPITTLDILAAASSAQFSMRAAVAETVGVTGILAGLTTATHTLTINAAAANKLVFNPLLQTVTSGACSATATTVERRDPADNLTTLGGAIAVALGSTATGVFTFHTASDCSSAPLANVSIGAGASTSAPFYVKAVKAEAVTATGVFAGLTSASQAVTVNPGSAFKLVFTTLARSISTGGCSLVLTVQRQDANGNPVTAGGLITVTLGDTGTSNLAFTTLNTCTGPAVTTVDIAAGASSADFYFSSNTAGTATITADSGTLQQGSQLGTVTAAAAAKVVYTTAPQTVAAAQCSAVVTVQRQDGASNPVTVGGALPLTVAGAATGMTFYSDAACTTSIGTTLTIAAGNSSASYYVKANVVEVTNLTASDGGALTDASQSYTTILGPAAKLVVTSGAQTVPALDCSALTTVTLQDAAGNTVNAGVGGVLVTLSDAGGAPAVTFFTDATCATPVPSNQRTMTAGTSTVTFYFKSDGTGTSTVSAAGPSLTPATQLETFGPSTPTKLVFTTTAPTIEAGFCQALTLERQDVASQATAPAYATQVTTLTASPTPTAPLLSTQFFSDPGCTVALVPPFNILSGAPSTVVYVKGRSGSLAGSIPGSQVYAVTAGSTSPTTLTSGAVNVTVLPMVRRGTCSLTSGTATPSDTTVICPITPNLSSIDRTMLVFTAGGSERSQPDDDMVTCRLRLNGSSLGEVVCERLGTLVAVTGLIPTNQLVINWQTVSFAYPASAGGVSVQHLTANHSASPQNVTIPVASTRASSFVLFSVRRPASFGPGPSIDLSVDGNDMFMAEMTSNTNVQLTFGTGGTFAANGSALTAFAIQVVNWSGATVVRNLRAGGTATSFGVAQVTPNLARSILLYSSKMASIGGTANANICARMVSGVITDTANLTFQRGCAGTSPADDLGSISWERVELPTNVSVQRNGANPLTGTIVNGGIGSTVTLATAVDRTRAVAFTGGQGTGGLANGRTNTTLDRLSCGQANLTFNLATELQLSRLTNNDQGDFGLFVMEVTP